MVESAPGSRFGRFGGRYVAEALWSPLAEVGDAFDQAVSDESFIDTYEHWLERRLGRPTPVTELRRLSDQVGGAQLWVKREDVCPGGTACANVAIAMALLADRMGRDAVVGDTATGDYGVALASAGAALGLDVRLFVGRRDLEQEPFAAERIEAVGATIEPVDAASRGRKAACAEAMRYWATHSDEALYAPSSAAMPDPYPRIHQYFQSVVGTESRVQLERIDRSPDLVVAPVGSGGFAAGALGEFVDQAGVRVVGVQSEGSGESGRHAASLVHGSPGVFQGTFSCLLQDEDGQIETPFTAATGLNMPVVAPQHAAWLEAEQAEYVSVTDDEARAAGRRLARTEGIVVALEAAHAVAYGLDQLEQLSEESVVLVALSGEGSRDLDEFVQTDADKEGG
jgi:tryptophan synthase beta chain